MRHGNPAHEYRYETYDPEGHYVHTLPPSIPMGCICAYTWSALPGRLVRNGALANCPADHAVVDAPCSA